MVAPGSRKDMVGSFDLRDQTLRCRGGCQDVSFEYLTLPKEQCAAGSSPQAGGR